MLQMQRDRQALRALPRLAPETGRHVPRPEGPGRALHALPGDQAGQRDGSAAGRRPREAVLRVPLQARLAADARHGLQNEGQRQGRWMQIACIAGFPICSPHMWYKYEVISTLV